MDMDMGAVLLAVTGIARRGKAPPHSRGFLGPSLVDSSTFHHTHPGQDRFCPVYSCAVVSTLLLHLSVMLDMPPSFAVPVESCHKC